MYYCWQYHNVTWIQKVINFYLSVLKILFFCLNELNFSGVFFTFIPENHYFQNTSFLKLTYNSFRIFCTCKVGFFIYWYKTDFFRRFFILLYEYAFLIFTSSFGNFFILWIFCAQKSSKNINRFFKYVYR